MSGLRYRPYPVDDYDTSTDERRRQERLKKKREERTDNETVEDAETDPDVIIQNKKREKHERKKAKARKNRPVLWDGTRGDDLDMTDASDDDGQQG